MQIAPMLSVRPLQGFEFNSSAQITGLLRELDPHQPHHHQQSKMEDLTEMFTLATWPEMNGLNKFPWDHHSGTILNAMAHSHYPSHDMLTASQINQQQAGLCDPSIHSSSNISPSDVNSANHAQLISRGMQEAAALDALRRIQGGMSNGYLLVHLLML